MYEICAITHCGTKSSVCVVESGLMCFYVNSFMKCQDVANVNVIDGLTGELLFEFKK